jgi:hypothetical protein
VPRRSFVAITISAFFLDGPRIALTRDMSMHRVLVVVLVTFTCGSMGCATPPAVSPEGANVAVNDGRSVEHCTALGLVSATIPVSTVTTQPLHYFLTPLLRNHTAERQGNYVEAMPVECTRGAPCAQSGIAYRCPEPSA